MLFIPPAVAITAPLCVGTIVDRFKNSCLYVHFCFLLFDVCPSPSPPPPPPPPPPPSPPREDASRKEYSTRDDKSTSTLTLPMSLDSETNANESLVAIKDTFAFAHSKSSMISFHLVVGNTNVTSALPILKNSSRSSSSSLFISSSSSPNTFASVATSAYVVCRNGLKPL